MHHNPYQSLVSLLSNVLDAYTTAFFIVDHKSRVLNLVAAQSLSKYLNETASLPLEESGILSQVQKVGHMIHLEKLPETSSNLPSKLPFYREGESHIKGLFAMPVGDGAGVLYVDTKYAWGFNDKQQKWIHEIAEVLHELLQRQDCLVQQHNLVRILDFWHHMDHAASEEHALEDYCRLLISECAQLLGTDYGFLALREYGSRNYHVIAGTPNVPRNIMSQRFPAKQGLIGWIFQNQKILLISRLNPQTNDHFLFTPTEGLPHQGTLWGLPAQMSLGHSVVMAFLSRKSVEWGADYQQAIAHQLRFFSLYLDQTTFREECDYLRTYDLSTDLINALAFEARVEGAVSSAMQSSTPFTLALIQFEPWHVLATQVSPKQLRQWQKELAVSLCEALPADVLVGQITENRFGMLFSESAFQDVKHHLSHLIDTGQSIFAGVLKGAKMQPYLAAVGFPQDGTRSDELWPLLYRRLFPTSRSQSESAGT